MGEVYNLFCGAIAGAASRTFTAPLELKKLQLQNPFIPNTTIRSVIQKEGILYLWKGNFTNCIRIAPQTAINYTVFKETKKLKLFKSENKNNYFSATVSAFIATMVSYPLDNARGRLALQTNNNHYMEINTSDISSNYTYTYKLVPGISEIKGGIKVLKDLEYTETIVNNMNETIDKITI